MSELENEGLPTSGDEGFDWSLGVEPSPEEQPPVAPEDTGEEIPEAEGRPRNADGTFAKRDERSPDIQALLDRYGGDVDKALQGALEAQGLINTLGNEIGQLRQIQEQQIAQQPQPRYDYSGMIEEDPARATMLAFQNGDPYAFDQAWQAWAVEDPANAAAWRAEKSASIQVEQLRREMQQQVQPVAQAQQQDRFNTGFVDLVRRYPDMEQHIPAISEYLESRPYQKQIFENSPDPQARLQVVEDAYLVAQARNRDTLRSATQEMATAQTQAAEKALEDAFVASGTNAVREAPQKSLQELITEGWDEIPTSLYHGE